MYFAERFTGLDIFMAKLSDMPVKSNSVKTEQASVIKIRLDKSGLCIYNHPYQQKRNHNNRTEDCDEKNK